jgi:hypothetical protein
MQHILPVHCYLTFRRLDYFLTDKAGEQLLHSEYIRGAYRLLDSDDEITR